MQRSTQLKTLHYGKCNNSGDKERDCWNDHEARSLQLPEQDQEGHWDADGIGVKDVLVTMVHVYSGEPSELCLGLWLHCRGYCTISTLWVTGPVKAGTPSSVALMLPCSRRGAAANRASACACR